MKSLVKTPLNQAKSVQTVFIGSEFARNFNSIRVEPTEPTFLDNYKKKNSFNGFGGSTYTYIYRKYFGRFSRFSWFRALKQIYWALEPLFTFFTWFTSWFRDPKSRFRGHFEGPVPTQPLARESCSESVKLLRKSPPGLLDGYISSLFRVSRVHKYLKQLSLRNHFLRTVYPVPKSNSELKQNGGSNDF